ncbi:Asp-tRNA(Asn)/Glu-tRNA(Gln) amidotransferase subunit GatC [Salinisphaera sp. USBA-960]|uniref:Asp-tRNA(Asn)/Glu-tRNA(Gln) amidotransferase subunit GatC n=1 Tax=Salinisphaera orenii TaxID=856731 RepID=UPI000DBE0448|nr:Asp-tRNA(Asn)/Glu-tRNA(Gln) amidotransferase subunit GatC [Salifodinibacter halophilus]NNC26939.1 Asp-tRNA(Asn)/Glu-tRNA(Gln) amidotransferase subunit GatC [Salifodinibacter halophilus]
MKAKAEDVRAVAALNRIRLADEDIEPTATTLSGIFELFDALAEVDTSSVEPMAHPLDLVARLRPDRAEPNTDTTTYQALAPDAENGLYRVPKVLG